VVLVTESVADPIFCKQQCKLSKQLLSPSNPPNAWKMHLNGTVCKAHHLGLKEDLISKEQQQQQHQAAAAAAAATGSTRQQQQQQQQATPGSSSSMSFKRQAKLPQGQLHSWQEM